MSAAQQEATENSDCDHRGIDHEEKKNHNQYGKESSTLKFPESPPLCSKVYHWNREKYEDEIASEEKDRVGQERNRFSNAIVEGGEYESNESNGEPAGDREPRLEWTAVSTRLMLVLHVQSIRWQYPLPVIYGILRYYVPWMLTEPKETVDEVVEVVCCQR